MRDGLLVRKLDLGSFTGDAWATTGSQSPPVDGLELLVVSSPVLWVVIPYDGVLETSQPVTDLVATVDARLVKRVIGPQAEEWSAMTVPLTHGGAEEQLLGQELRDRDVTPGQRFFCAIPSVTVGTAPAAWVYITSGAREFEVAR